MQYRNCLKDIKPYIPGVLKEGAIKLASNENPLGMSPLAKKAVAKFLDKLYLYPDGGCVKLKEKLAKKYGLAPENFIIGNGSDEIFLFIAGLLIEAGDEMLTSEVTFSEYEFATRLFGGKPLFAPLKDGKYQLKEIAKRITPKTKLIFMANPNNPTGTYFNETEFKDFMKVVPENVLVVLDEAYYEYAEAKDYPDTLSLLNSYKNILICRTFSKIYGLSGLRVGYAVGDKELILNLNKTREPFNVNAAGQVAAEAALEDSSFLKRAIANNQKGKEYLYQEFDKLGLKYFQTEANFIFVYIKQDCLQAFKKMMDLGVTIRPMKSFGINDAIRVTIGTPAENKKFIACLKKIL